MPKHDIKFFGSTTVGEKGQAVIPQEAREYCNLEKGEKLLVFGIGPDLLMISKLSGLHKIENKLSNKLNMIRGVMNNNK